MNKHRMLRVLLAVVSVSHLLLGLLAVAAPVESVARVAAALYGATLDVTPALQHILRILGAFMIAVGLMSSFAFFSPEKHEGIIAGVVVLLLLRVAERLIFAREIQSTFQVSTTHLWIQSIFFLILAVALFIVRPRASRADRS